MREDTQLILHEKKLTNQAGLNMFNIQIQMLDIPLSAQYLSNLFDVLLREIKTIHMDKKKLSLFCKWKKTYDPGRVRYV